MNWVEDVKNALEELGGEAHLSDIYRVVKIKREGRGDTTGKLENWVRNALQQNSRGRGHNIFEPKFPVEERRGIWMFKNIFKIKLNS